MQSADRQDFILILCVQCSDILKKMDLYRLKTKRISEALITMEIFENLGK